MRRQRNTEKNTANELNKLVVEKDKIINKELFTQYFKFQILIDMLKDLYKAKNTDKTKIQVDLIKSRLEKLKDGINRMSENEIKI